MKAPPRTVHYLFEQAYILYAGGGWSWLGEGGGVTGTWLADRLVVAGTWLAVRLVVAGPGWVSGDVCYPARCTS